MTHDVNGCCGISLSRYPVSSKVAVYKCKHQRDFVDSRYRQLLILAWPIFVEVI